MIKSLRENLETKLGFGVHYVSITERENRPCASVSRSLLDTHKTLKKRNGFAVAGIKLTFYADDYEELEDIAQKFGEDYDGERLVLLEGEHPVTIDIEDEDDDCYPAPDGADDWIYAREIILRVHHKFKGKDSGRRSNTSKAIRNAD